MQERKRKLQVMRSDDKQSPNLKKSKKAGFTRITLQAKEGVELAGTEFKKQQSKSVISLDQLPMVVLEKLITLLDVVSLSRLSSTNHFFQQLITGRFFLNINFPFDQAFLDELGATSIIEKKPLLRLTCSKVASIFPTSEGSASPRFRSLGSLVKLQLSTLDLSRLQELTLGAADRACTGIPCICDKCKEEVSSAKIFDRHLLLQLGQGLSRQLRSLKVLVDDLYLPSILKNIRSPCLQSLTIVISASSTLCKLEKILPLVRVSELTVMAMCVLKRSSKRLLFNAHVKRLHVRGPCDLQFHVQMLNLEHITVRPLDQGTEYGHIHDGDLPCRFSGPPRSMHGVGQCCVDIRAILQGYCPNIKTFCGINLRGSAGKIKSKQEVRRLLHRDFIANGGALELKQWSKGRWRGRNLTMAYGYGHGILSTFQKF